MSPFSFRSLIRLISQGVARYYTWQMTQMVEPYGAEIEQALGRAREVVGAKVQEPVARKLEGESRPIGRF